MLFVMTKAAVDNYGEKYRNVVLEVTHHANKYMSSKEFYAKGMPTGYHPGFDGSCNDVLYDLKIKETGEDLPFSLYSWELKRIS